MMVQNTPVAMLLVVAEQGVIVFANIAARQLLHGGKRLEGHHLQRHRARRAVAAQKR